jgi:hypothetical protein
MRCQEGDRAVIVGGYRDNIGCLVDIERESKYSGLWIVTTLGPTLAQVGGKLQVLPARASACISDEFLWPLPLLKLGVPNGGT